MRHDRITVAIAATLVSIGGCSLFVDVNGFSGDDADAGSAADASNVGDAPASEDASDAAKDASTDAARTPIVVEQHRVCSYASSPDAFSCAFPVATAPGNAFLVHFYYNFPNQNLFFQSLTDDNANVYSSLNVGNASCPGSKLPGEVCCTTTASEGTCQGWAVVTNAQVATKNPSTIKVTIGGGGVTTAVMGAEIFEIAGLADAPLDHSASMGLAPGSTLATPTIVTSTTGELVLVGVAFYSSGTASIAPPKPWVIDEDPGYYAGAMFQISGAAGTSYGGDSLGVATNLAKPGTSTILALMGK